MVSVAMRPLRDPAGPRRDDSHEGRRRRAPRGSGDQLYDEILDATTELLLETACADGCITTEPSTATHYIRSCRASTPRDALDPPRVQTGAPHWEEQPLCVEFGREDAGDLARPDIGNHPTRVDGAVIKAAAVEQQAAIAQVTGSPAVAPRTHADLMAVGPRTADRGDYVVGVVSLHDHVGKAVRHEAIPHGLPGARFRTPLR